MEKVREIKPLGIRMPEELRIWLKHRAVDNRRSLNSEIVFSLEEFRARELAAKKEERNNG